MKGAELEEHCTQRLIHCGRIIVMDSSAGNNALIQDNYMGPMRKEHYPHAEEEPQEWKHRRKKNCLNTWDDADMIWDADCK